MPHLHSIEFSTLISTFSIGMDLKLCYNKEAAIFVEKWADFEIKGKPYNWVTGTVTSEKEEA